MKCERLGLLFLLQLVDHGSILHLIRAYISCNKLQEAKNKLDLLQKTGKREEECCILEALLLRQLGKTREALELLEKSSHCSSLEYFLLLGDLYWELEMWDKSLIPYLKVIYITEF